MLHPVLTEFRELLDRERGPRMYVERMIAEVARTKPYLERHLESVDQLRLINPRIQQGTEHARGVGARGSRTSRPIQPC